MKTHHTDFRPVGLRALALKAQERGSAVVIFLALLSIMLVLVAANGKTLLLLKQDLRLLEQRQVQRLERSQTNSPLAPAPASASSQTPP